MTRSDEIVQRCVHAFEFSSAEVQAHLTLLLHEMNLSLDATLKKVKADRIEIAENLSQIRNRVSAIRS